MNVSYFENQDLNRCHSLFQISHLFISLMVAAKRVYLPCRFKMSSQLSKQLSLNIRNDIIILFSQ